MCISIISESHHYINQARYDIKKHAISSASGVLTIIIIKKKFPKINALEYSTIVCVYAAGEHSF